MLVTAYRFDGKDNIKLGIKDVIYNPPATIVLWEDGTKTVSKCDKEDKFDKLTGFALCVAKHYAGNNQMREWMEKWVYGTHDKGSVKKSESDKKELMKKLDKQIDDIAEALMKLIYNL